MTIDPLLILAVEVPDFNRVTPPTGAQNHDYKQVIYLLW